MRTYYTTMRSPIGTLTLCSDGDALTRLSMAPCVPQPGWVCDRAPFGYAVEQLDSYFSGERRNFDLPLAAEGTPFQQSVWKVLRTIPYGEVRSYGDIARRIGNPNAVRAVGRANGSNPIAVIIPCHRVVGSNGTLTGFGGGLERKAQLLELEGLTVGQRVQRDNPLVNAKVARAAGVRFHPRP